MATKQQYFDHSELEYANIQVKTLKQLKRNTKIEFKTENKTINSTQEKLQTSIQKRRNEITIQIKIK